MIYKGNRAAWAYIVARTKVMKSRLLKPEDFRKLLNMEFDEIVRYIGETEYKKEIDELGYKFTGPRLLDHALYANLARTYRKLIEVSFGASKFLIMKYLEKWDVWNIINIIRGKMANVQPEVVDDILVPAGERDMDFWKTLLVKDIEEIVKSFEGTPYYEPLSKIGSEDMSKIEDGLYKVYYRELLKLNPSDFAMKLFLDFIKMEIDIRNVKTLLRLKAEDATPDEIMECTIPGGYELTEEELRKLAAMPIDEMIKALEGYWFWNDVQIEGKEVAAVEIEFDKVWIKTISKRASNYPLSILPVLQYIVLKKVEVDNLRVLGWGKYYGLPSEEIERQMVIL
ncbi:ATP synthase A1 subunit C [Archaeoglobus fulgidus]|jgi:V/A-type H+-transporting ATPase subunit C|nr:ATP synthase A1 subunit C [Archaeoglobus fulgidus]AIG98038.1 ATP synthase A1, C subunit [Archaeoglobus fulgidus DSM 8774]KUJ93220.1 MAG: V-type ATP synthase subunit C [Archaeoglobus fulgidus]KUK06871.1 MAG: V-type ATP synthase subunit C [Archaeoglobus fulgidus]